MPAFFADVRLRVEAKDPVGNGLSDGEAEIEMTESDSVTEEKSEFGGDAYVPDRSESETEKEESPYVNYWSYSTDDQGVIIRDAVIDSGKGGESVEIIQLTDIHINYCNEEDLLDPVLKSTYENRKWLASFKSLANLERCLNLADHIKGTFCGHHHNDFYTEILARGADGSFTKIPQYVVCGVPYLNGHAMRITVK